MRILNKSLPVLLILTCILFCLSARPCPVFAQGIIRPAEAPEGEGWTTQTWENGGFEINYKFTRITTDPDGRNNFCQWIKVRGGWDNRSFADPEAIRAELSRSGAEIESLSISGFSGYMRLDPPKTSSGGHSDEGYYSSEYSRECVGLVMKDGHVALVYFGAGASGDFFQSNLDEVASGGREMIERARAIFDAITITLDRPATTSVYTPLPPPRNEEHTPIWLYVLGAGVLGLTLVAAAAAAIAIALKGKKVPPGKAAGYVLQLSRDRIDLADDRPGSFEITVWEVDAQAGHHPAAGASITVTQPPESRSFLQVTPSQGQTKMTCTISLKGGAIGQEIILTVVAQAGGTSHSAQVRVTGTLRLEAWVLRKKQADVAYRREGKEWTLPEIVGYFHGGDEVPVLPPFKWYFPEPRIKASPDIIEIRELYLHDEKTQAWTIKTALRRDADLLNDKTLMEWLHSNGKITVTILVEAYEPIKHLFTAKVTYRLVPYFELLAWSYDASWRSPSGHRYKELSLDREEFAVDGYDELKVASCFCRTDDHRNPPLPFHVADITGAEADGIEKENFKVEELAVNDRIEEEPYFLYTVRALRPLLNTQSMAAGTLRLKCTSKARKGAENCVIPADSFHKLKPLFLYLKLWIYPGRRPGTSEASAFVALPPSAVRALSGVSVRLRVESQGSGTLQREEAEELMTDGRGLTPAWTLRYSGINWQNCSNARFRVLCGISCPPSENQAGSAAPVREALALTIDVGANARALVADIYNRRDQLNLRNPVFDGMGALLPPMLRGPFVNFVNVCNNSLFNDYICAHYATRLRNYMLDMRFGPDIGDADPQRQLDADVCFPMNGIEPQEYSVMMLFTLTHHFAGFYLSGTASEGDPRFIDPWWSQHWSSPAYRSLGGLDTLRSEVTYIAAAYVSLAVLTNALYAVALARGWITVMDMARWLTIIGADASAAGHTSAAMQSVGVFKDARVLNHSGEYDRHHRNWNEESVRYLAANIPVIPPVDDPIAW